MLFLRGEGGTLRVLIPSPGAIRELLTKQVERWLGNQLDGTHTRKALDQFAMSDEMLLQPISHPQVVDGLDAACELPLTERPQVRVIGRELQPGVVMATALEVSDRRSIFFPSGLFNTLTTRLEPFIGAVDQPVMLEAVQAG